MNNLVIGIEGYVGAGKTSICRELTKKISNTILLNGGNLYRAIIYTLMNNKMDLKKLEKEASNLDIKELMDLFKISLEIKNNETIIFVDGTEIDEEKIQSKEASIAVSSVGGKAKEDSLFDFARELIDKLKQKYNVIVSGRGINKIYPKIDYHFFITADLEERVKRKLFQYKNKESEEEIRNNIIKRDKLQEEAGYYKIHNNTIIVDVTKCKTVEESTNKVIENIKIPEVI